ncbi:hypothetical protein BLIC_b02179 [Bifidobacterium longum subsp. infantis]|nr:hypothetical protein BLIC_b02179 [Bifidobacterium longum subsp. infantis]
MTRLHVLDRAELRLQAHGRGQMPVARGAHRGVGFVAVQADAGAGEFEMDLGSVQCRRRIGQMSDLGRDAGQLHAPGEVLERCDLLVGGGDEFGHIGRIGHGEVAPLAHDAQHTLLGEGHERGERGVESGRSEPVAAKTGIDLHMHAGGLAEPARGGGQRFDAGQGADRHVDVGGDQIIERRRGAVVYPGQDMAPVGADAKPAQQERLMRLRGAEPCGPAGERGQGGGQQAMAVCVGLDHAHHRRARCGATHHGDQMGHVVAHGFEVHDGLRGVLPAGGLVIGFAPLGGECDFRCCVHAHGYLLLRGNMTCGRFDRMTPSRRAERRAPFSPGSRTLMSNVRFSTQDRL